MAVELLEKKNIRLDLYLFYIRIFKSRSLSTKYIFSNRLRISGQVTKKPHKLISVGDVLTLSINDQVKILEVLDIPKRRGPFVETLFFYKDLENIHIAIAIAVSNILYTITACIIFIYKYNIDITKMIPKRNDFRLIINFIINFKLEKISK